MERNHSAPSVSAAETGERIREHLDRGAPWEACDAFREAVAAGASDAELLYRGALAHARVGATHEAHALLDRAQAASTDAPHLLSEILSLRGRLWKDGLHRAPDAPGAAETAERARKEYLAAYTLQHDPYPGINAATLSWLLGERAAARDLAHDIAARLEAQTTVRTCWDHATAGEAMLLLGRYDEAQRRYAAAYRVASGDAGSVATMRRQVSLLARALPEAAQVLPLLPTADVVAFAGHMIDAADRTVPRFPAALAPAVHDALRDHLQRLHKPIVYTSAACGADLLCIEAALELGAEVNVVLPFDREDFVRTSVAVGGAGWPERFDAALSRVGRVIMATEESHLGDDVLFEYAAELLEGFSLLRAAQLQTTPSMLCVIDAASRGRLGGTHASFERWKDRIGAPQTIDLGELRAQVSVDGAAGGSACAAPSAGSASSSSRPTAASATPIVGRPQRTLKTLLFADFAGFSRLHDAVAPLFQESFWNIASEQIDACPVRPLLASTWGDALYVVFDSPRAGAEFALAFLARMVEVDWTAVGLPDSSQIRVALHAGPVFCGFDPIMGRDNYFGSSVTKAARIEPITPPGMVYVSEAFAATLAATGLSDFALEYVGRLALAKGYGESRIYRLERR
jgi:tetratricopeptide (TPR) repeat protein